MKVLLENLIHRRECRFLLAGGTLALLFFILVFGFVRIGLAPFTSSVLAYVIALGIGYLVQRNWSFRAHHPHATSLPRYLALQAACAAMSGLSAQAATTIFQLNPIMMSISNTLSMGLISYIVSLKWVFPDDKSG